MSIVKKSKIAKVVSGLLGFAMVLGLSFGTVVPSASAVTVEELTAQINSLLSTIAALQAQLSTMGGAPATGGTGFTFMKNLKMGDSNSDVKQLQMVLNASADTQVAASGVGSSGNESMYFGGLTKAAVIKFQNKYASEVLAPVGLTSGTGFVGVSTRAKLNALNGPIVPPPPPEGTDLCVNIAGVQTTIPSGMVRDTAGNCSTAPSGTGMTVSSAAQPSNGLTPEGAARIPFTKFTVTAGYDGPVTLNSVTIEKSGLANDLIFAGIVLLDDTGTQLGLAKTLNSNHQAVIGEAVIIPAGTSKTFTVAANMAASLDNYAGEVAGLNVVAVNSPATVSGSLPITGAMHTTNATFAIGSVTVARGTLDPAAQAGGVSKNVGTTGYTFSSVKVTAGSAENIVIKSIRWNQASSSASSDLENVVTVVEGTSYPTTVSSNGKYYTANFGAGVTVDKGFSKEISIKGDIIGGSGRTVAFNVEKTTDLYLVGASYGYGITPPTSGTGFSAGSIWYAGSTISINAGSITVSNDTGVAAQNISINAANQPLGGFTVEVKGEPITVAQLVFNLGTIGDEPRDITNVSLVDQNGAVLAGPVDGSGTAGASWTDALTFSSTITFPVGITKLQLKGKLNTDFATNDTVQASTTPSSDWTTVTGTVTGTTIVPSPSSAVSGNTMTVKASAMTISVASDPVAQTVVAGASALIFSKYVLDAGASGEDVKVRQLLLDFSTDAGATNFTSCQLWDGETALNTGSNAVNPSAAASSTTFTLDNVLIVPKGVSKTLALKCNTSSSASGDAYWGISAAQSATGATSDQALTPTLYAATGPAFALSSTGGALAVALDAGSPSYKVAAAGTSDNTISVLRFSATTEDISLQSVALQMSSATTTNADVVKVTLWDGATKIGEASFTNSVVDSATVTNYLATSTLLNPLTILKNTDKIITVKADFATQGFELSGHPGALVTVDWDGGANIGTKGVGASSGLAIYATGTDTSSSGARVFRSVPTITMPGLAETTLTAGRKDLFRFNVTAGPQGQVGIAKITFRIATSSATASSDMVDAVNVYAFTDSSYSTPVTGVQSDGSLAFSNYDLTSNWVTANTQIEIGAATSANASTTVIVPAGETRYFKIQGDIANLAGTSYSVSTVLEGDASYSANIYPSSFGTATTTYLATSTYLWSSAQNDFVWRPFSTTTSQSATADDYANGYGFFGMPLSSSNSQTLNK